MSKNRESMIKNIHIVATENSSKLSYNKDGVLFLHRLQWRKGTQHIYITSDEEIKKGSIVKIPCGVGKVKELHWKYGDDFPSYIVEDVFSYKLRYGQKEGELQTNSFSYEDVKKIILTTDPELIKDSVQGIDDEFLEWFVKNPNCEKVEIKITHRFGELPNNEFLSNKIIYKAIIPKEKLKQETIEEFAERINPTIKQETLEEVFNIIDDEKCRYSTDEDEFWNHYKIGVIDGLKWQQKGSYSEEDMIEASKYGYNFHKTTQFPKQEFEDSCIRNTKQWLTQFRKK
jgi:hypothetical protein